MLTVCIFPFSLWGRVRNAHPACYAYMLRLVQIVGRRARMISIAVEIMRKNLAA